ncbi:UvrD-helicase domain-containing protein [Coprobacter fastidiosus]|uniref:UvrD-helicase domain-containing protein n=1 Tax=Coprobacter fastidiosus TaxID=1099853 RepID=UPI003AB267BF
MAEERLINEIEDEFHQIMELVYSGENFLLSGGAGSGKTYSLVQVIKQVIADFPTAKVACMTYTNAAVREIEERVNHKNLNVSTIHDFLWDNIKHFQKELKQALIVLLNDENVQQIKIDDIANVPSDYYDNRTDPISIQYKEYLKLKDGIISHDEILLVSEYMFHKYPKLCDIVKDKYKFILIDEYQDTHSEVVKILLEYFPRTPKKCIVGFFGDAMQAIYDDGIGNIDLYKGDSDGQVKEVKKVQNRRNPKTVITLANRLRTDGIIQEPSNDISAPNMVDEIPKEGNILFLYSENDDNSIIKRFLSERYAWNFNDINETKELNLTHNLIADKAGFRSLMDIYDKDLILTFNKRIKNYIKENNILLDFSEKTFGEVIDILQHGKSGRELNKVQPTHNMQLFIDANPDLYSFALNYNFDKLSKIYVDKDQLLDDKKQSDDDDKKKGSKRDSLIRHLFKIQKNIELYKNRQYNDFLRKTDYPMIRTIADKRILRDNIESLINVGNKTIEEVINDAHEMHICLIDEKLERFKLEKEYVYNRVKSIKYSEFQKLYEYLEGKTPFSTQHKTKGAEFNNVLVVLDNGGWNNYNFESVFVDNGKSETIKSRSLKIFYVCCTRAKENLAVFYHKPSANVIAKAQEWFGEDNVIRL